MERKQLTKTQKRRASRTRLKKAAKLFEQTMGPPPQIPEDLILALGVNTDCPATPPDLQEPWERAPDHIVKWGELPRLDHAELTRMTKEASESRTYESDLRAGELKLKYPQYWSKRGGAGFISRAEAKAGTPISERTVRSMIARSKK
jgi:hypothetical protein